MNSINRDFGLSGIKLLKEYFIKKIRSIVKNTENNFPDFIKDCLPIGQTHDLNDDVKIVFFFGAGASLPSGIEETSFINEKALENIDLKVLERYVSTEEFLQLGLDKDLLKKDPEKFKASLSFEQAMGLLRLFYGDFPECAEVLFFQKFFPRQDPIDPWRDLLPIPLIYEITAHLVNIGLVDHIITTNFDELLDRALFLESQQTKEIEKIYHLSAFQSALKNKIYEKKSTLIKIHGTISYPLTLRQLVDNVQEFEPAKSKLLTEILTNSVVVIIGFGFNTPNLQKLFFDLIHKNKIRDLFLVKRSLTAANDFLKFLMKDRLHNIILSDCETFAIDLVEELEKLELQVSKIQKNINKENGENDEIKIVFSRFFHKFSRHLFRNFIFKDLRAYPAPCVKFLVEFVLSLFQGKGLITDRGLYDNEVIMSFFSEDRSLLKNALEAEVNNLYKFYNGLKNKKEQNSQGPCNENHVKEIFNSFKQHLINFLDFFIKDFIYLVEQTPISIDLLEKLEILASFLDSFLDCKDENKDKKEVDISLLLSREFDLDYLIDFFHQMKLSILNKELAQEFNHFKNCVDQILKNLYEIKFCQIEQIKKLEDKKLHYLVEKLAITDKSESADKSECANNIKISILKEIYDFKSFFEDNKDMLPIRMYFEQFYWLLCNDDKKDCENYKKAEECLGERSEKFVECLIKFLLDNKVLFYDKIYYLLIDNHCFNNIKENLVSFFFKNKECKQYQKKIESLSDIVKTFDIIVKPYHFVLPFVDKEETKEKICEVYEIKNRVELQLLTEYLLKYFKNRKSEYNMFVIADSGEWVLKAIDDGLLKLDGSDSNQSGNIYLVVSKKIDQQQRPRYCHACLVSSKEERFKAIDIKICDLKFCRNNLHLFLLRGNREADNGKRDIIGIIFHRNLKSSFISPIFLKAKVRAKADRLKLKTISILDDLLQEVEEKCASKLTNHYQ